jgi:hypothetical protein
MSPSRYALLLFFCAALLPELVGCSSLSGRQIGEKNSRIALGCGKLLLSAKANETTIATNDPRVPSAIRELQPQQILLAGNLDGRPDMLVIIRAGRPSVYEYWLRAAAPHSQILFAGGPGYKHLEVVWETRD